MKIRVGFGFDVHQLVAGRDLWLEAYAWNMKRIVGPFGCRRAGSRHLRCFTRAANMRDIGYHFPDTAGEYKDVDSKLLLAQTIEIIATKGYKVGNIDATICAERPKLKAHIPAMRKRWLASWVLIRMMFRSKPQQLKTRIHRP